MWRLRLIEPPSTGSLLHDWLIYLVLGLMGLLGAAWAVIVRMMRADVEHRFKAINARVAEMDIAVGACETGLSGINVKVGQLEAYNFDKIDRLRRIEDNQTNMIKNLLDNQSKMAEALLAAVKRE